MAAKSSPVLDVDVALTEIRDKDNRIVRSSPDDGFYHIRFQFSTDGNNKDLNVYEVSVPGISDVIGDIIKTTQEFLLGKNDAEDFTEDSIKYHFGWGSYVKVFYGKNYMKFIYDKRGSIIVNFNTMIYNADWMGNIMVDKESCVKVNMSLYARMYAKEVVKEFCNINIISRSFLSIIQNGNLPSAMKYAVKEFDGEGSRFDMTIRALNHFGYNLIFDAFGPKETMEDNKLMEEFIPNYQEWLEDDDSRYGAVILWSKYDYREGLSKLQNGIRSPMSIPMDELRDIVSSILSPDGMNVPRISNVFYDPDGKFHVQFYNRDEMVFSDMVDMDVWMDRNVFSIESGTALFIAEYKRQLLDQLNNIKRFLYLEELRTTSDNYTIKDIEKRSDKMLILLEGGEWLVSKSLTKLFELPMSKRMRMDFIQDLVNKVNGK